MVSRFILVLICGIIALIAAIMSYAESATTSNATYLMFLSSILIFVVAALIYRPDKTA